MEKKKGFTALAVWISTQELVALYCHTNGLTICAVIDQALREYIARWTHADLAHVRAASDPIDGGGEVRA